MGRRHRAQVLDSLGDLHPRGRGRGGQHVHRRAGDKQRIPGMHQPRRMVTIADQVRNVVYDGDFRMDHGMPTADAADGQPVDGEFVTDLHGPPRRAQLCGGLRVGVQRRVRVGVDQCGQPRGVGVVGVLMGDENRRHAGDALESVREIARVEQQRGAVELGE